MIDLVIEIYFKEYKVGDDPHQKLADALGISRTEAKRKAYITIYSMPFLAGLIRENAKPHVYQD